MRGQRLITRIAIVAAVALVQIAGTTAVPTQAAPAPFSAPSAIDATGPTSQFAPVGPVRLTDTRLADCHCLRVDAATIRVPVAGVSGIPAAITAVAVTVTAPNMVRDGFVTAYPAGGPRPETSTLNARAGVVASNSAVIPIGVDGSIDVFAQWPTDLVVDVTGVFAGASTATSGRFQATAPTRLVDTRVTTPAGLAAGSTLTVPLPAGVATDAIALAVNVTTVSEIQPGFVAGYAAGSAPPATSFMNPDGSGRAKAAAVILPASSAGITLFTTAGGHLIVDVVGWFTGASAAPSADGLFVPVSPSRLLDTRSNGPRLWSTATRELANPLGGAAALVTNVTLARPDDTGFVTAYPAGTPQPSTSSINAAARDIVIANLAITTTSTRGIAYYSNAGTDLVVDVTGYFTGAPVAATLPVPPRVLANPRVLLIGDSTFAALNVIPAAQHALRGFQPLLDLEPCRRLASPSCKSAFTLRTPPTAVQAIAAAPPLVDIVVIRAGYNDGSNGFDNAVRSVLLTARAKGVRTVLWLTYSDGTGNQLVTYVRHNATLYAMANSGAYPELVVADWRTYASGSSLWYASDHVHMMRNGAWATADYVSRWVAHVVGNPCPVPWTPGGAIDDPCPSPDAVRAFTGTVPDLTHLYGL